MPFHLLKRYSRAQIHDAVGGGDLQSYLPHLGNNVLCGCFDPDFNRRAPIEIDIGPGADVSRFAQRLLEQGTAIPVFLKRQPTEWEYVGQFRADLYCTDTNDLYPAKSFRRKDAIAVLYLKGVPDDSTEDMTDEPSILAKVAVEGGSALVAHLRRERSRQLSETKRRAFRSEHGQLTCQACALTESELPVEIGEGCFEVHHTLPLSHRHAPSVTKLDDLVLLCANCHRLIHRSDPMLSAVELTSMLADARQRRKVQTGQ